MKLESTIDGYTFPYLFSDNNAYIYSNGLKGYKLWKFNRKIKQGFDNANKKLKITFDKKECFYGPFKGEFGHFTAHTLPFLMYLHKNKVKIHYCGMELHKPFLIDEEGNSIIYKF